MKIRLPAELKRSIEETAKASGRTLNAEIVARIQGSYTTPFNELPLAIKNAIADEIEDRGGTEEEALLRLVLAGLAQGGTLLYVTLTPGTKYEQFKELLKAGETVIPPGASLIMERKKGQS